MSNIDYYYENTKNALPHKITQKFIKMNIKEGTAIDLGCGTGRDTVFLIKNNWKVTAIDREDTRELIEEKLDNKEKERFNFICQNFENIELEKTNLIVSNFAIPFCSKKNFNEFWEEIVDSIEKDGYFVGNFFGLKDSWAKLKPGMVFLTKEQVLNLFEDFEIVEFEENEKDGKTGLGKMKHWHTYNIIARKYT